MRFRLTILFYIILFDVSAQKISKLGSPKITNFSNQEYHGQNQNWQGIQAKSGLIYIANNAKLIEYDGINWNSVVLPNNDAVRSIKEAEDGTIYIGGIGELGRLIPSNNGSMIYESLVELIPKETQLFSHIWQINELKDEIIFVSYEYLLVYNKKTKSISTIKADGYFSYSNQTQNTLYVSQSNKLFYYQFGSLKKLKNLDGKNIRAVVDYNDQYDLVISEQQGFFLYDGDTSIQLNAKASDFLKKGFFKIRRIDQNYIAIITIDRGVLIVDNEGLSIQLLNDQTGLPTNVCYDVFLDNSMGLWIMHSSGMSRAEVFSPLYYFDKRHGLESAYYTYSFKDDLYVSSQTNTWVLNKASQQSSDQNFRAIHKELFHSWVFSETSSSLICAGENAIYEIKAGVSTKILSFNSTVWAISNIPNSDGIIVGTSNGQLYTISKGNNSWYKTKLDKISRSVDFLVEGNDGNIWMSNSAEGVFKIRLNHKNRSIESFTKYGEAHGLPNNIGNRVYRHQESPVFTTQKGVYLYNKSTNLFEQDKRFSSALGEQFILRFEQESSKKYWSLSTTTGLSKVELQKDIFSANNYPEQKFKSFSFEQIRAKDTLLFITNLSEGLAIMNGTQDFPKPKTLKAMLRSFSLTNLNDSTIYNGFGEQRKITLEPHQNSIRIKFSSNCYENTEDNLYTWRLKGLEDEWTNWTNETKKDYTNLPHGNYAFQVKVKNIFGDESTPDAIYFNITAPWYLTWWAYLLYFLLFILFIKLLLILNSKRLIAENERLEKTIKERLKEIQEQKSVIAQSLVEKESLLKEIHHRVKNNLQIIANLLYLQSGKFEDENIKNVLEEGQGRVRSMALIHQKLYENEDLKSIPFGEYVLELVNEIKTSFGEQAANVNIKVDAPEAFFDVDSAVPLGLIINELSTNSFKYAFEGKNEGQFNIFLTKSGDEYELHISDNGKGIPEEIDIRKTRSLGLRLVRILSEQLEGEYSFESENGMSFKLKFAA